LHGHGGDYFTEWRLLRSAGIFLQPSCAPHLLVVTDR
jgi:hypothetical protein